MSTTAALHRIVDQFSLAGLLAAARNPRSANTATTAAVAAAAAGVPLLAYLARSYRGWLALGRGGLPPNPLGYLTNVLCQLIARRDVRVVAPYTMEDAEAAYGLPLPPASSAATDDGGPSLARRSFYPGPGPGGVPPPARRGPRPDVPGYVIPQRQTTEQAAPAMLARMEGWLAAVAAANAGAVRSAPSGLEGPFRNALFADVDDPSRLPRFLRGTGGEFVHPHDEGSMHAIFSLVDAARAIELGWAERHHFSGVGSFLPWGYLMIYAPRDDAEFEAWKTLITASVRFNAAALGVPEVVIP